MYSQLQGVTTVLWALKFEAHTYIHVPFVIAIGHSNAWLKVICIKTVIEKWLLLSGRVLYTNGSNHYWHSS